MFAVFEESDAEAAALGHGLSAVLDDVEDSLLEQVDIDFGDERLGGKVAGEDHVPVEHFVGGEGDDVGDDLAEVVFDETDLNRAGEVDEGLNDAVEAVNFGVDDLEVAVGSFAAFAEFSFEQFQMNDDCVDGVLDFMADAGGEPTDGGHAAGEFQFGFDDLDGLLIMECEQSAESLSRAVVVNEVEGDYDAMSGLGENFFLYEGESGLPGIADSSPENGVTVEDFAGVMSEDLVTVESEKAADGVGDEHGASVSSEEENAVLEVSEDLVEVFLEG